MMKAIFFLLVVFAVYLLLRLGRRARPEEKSRGSAPNSVPEVMVSCARCGLHIPASESLPASGRYYCCEEHRRLDFDRDAG
jgi:uncharacterized protein